MKIQVRKLLVAFAFTSLAGTVVASAADLVTSHPHYRELPRKSSAYHPAPRTAYYVRECSVLVVSGRDGSRYTDICHPVVNMSPLSPFVPGSGHYEGGTIVSFRAQ